jgi:sigma-B regulation protein RsbU (phosphoserine phosphatase)
MALAKTLARSLTQRVADTPEHWLTAVNREISRDNPATMFVSAILGVIDGRNGQVEFASAGHPAPFLLRAHQPPRELDGASGPPLGIDEEFSYTSQRLLLEPGDLLVVITDGVSEAEDGRQSRYGVTRALQLFHARAPASAADACELLKQDVAAFGGGTAPSDDLTILAVRYIGPERARNSLAHSL